MPTKDPEKIRRYKRERYHRKRAAAPELVRQKSVRKDHRLRMRTLGALGGRCVKCGFSDERALEIDHVDGLECGSRNHRKTKVKYRAILAGVIPLREVQILCANCHAIKTREEKAQDRAKVLGTKVLIHHTEKSGITQRYYSAMRVWLLCYWCKQPFLVHQRVSELRKFCSNRCVALRNARELKVWEKSFTPGVQTKRKTFLPLLDGI